MLPVILTVLLLALLVIADPVSTCSALPLELSFQYLPSHINDIIYWHRLLLIHDSHSSTIACAGGDSGNVAIYSERV